MIRPGFWLPRTAHLTGPDLDDRRIGIAERELGRALPAALLHVLREQNGGHLRYSGWIDTSGKIWEVPFLRALDGTWQADARSRGLPNGLVVLAAASEGLLVLDYRNDLDGVTPSVGIWSDDNAWTTLAHTFDAFLEGLVDLTPVRVLGFDALEDDDVEDLVDVLDRLWESPCDDEDADGLRNWSHPTRLARDGELPATLLLRRHIQDGSGHAWPWAPEATWVLEIDARDDHALWLEHQLRRTPNITVRLLHQPPAVL